MSDRPPIGPLLVGAQDAARVCGLGRTLFLQADKTGELGPQAVRIGARRLWCVTELAEWARHGCPSRGEWAAIWPQIRAQTQDVAQIGSGSPSGGGIHGGGVHD